MLGSLFWKATLLRVASGEMRMNGTLGNLDTNLYRKDFLNVLFCGILENCCFKMVHFYSLGFSVFSWFLKKVHFLLWRLIFHRFSFVYLHVVEIRIYIHNFVVVPLINSSKRWKSDIYSKSLLSTVVFIYLSMVSHISDVDAP